jgi:hypothetical protein
LIILVDLLKVDAFLKLSLSILFVFLAFFTYQRSAISITLIFFAFYFLKYFRLKFVILIFLIFLCGIIVPDDFSDKYYSRILEIPELVTFHDRSSGYIRGLEIFFNAPFGLGMGATTNMNSYHGYAYGIEIVDANHMRILTDLGFIGLFLFLIILLTALYYTYLNNIVFSYGMVLLAFNAIALGTNIFDTYYVGWLYWLVLGIISSHYELHRSCFFRVALKKSANDI